MKTFEKPTLEIADIFNNFEHLLGKIPREQRKVIQDIKNCRTNVLGGHLLQCDICNFSKHAYNSCRNRHCPKCQFLTRVRWIEARVKELLPCPYFHVVFTVPSELRLLILRNKKDSYDILFKAASQTIKEVALTQHQVEIGCIGVLHTWGQNLIDHPHIHFIVPGGGLNHKKTKWRPFTQDYLLPVKMLSKVFRAKVLESFDEAFDKGKLKFVGQIEYLSHYSNFKELLINCSSKEFVVDSRKPFAGPQQVINYLGQYTHRIAISNYRLVRLEGETISFKVRDKENPEKKVITNLHVKEFMRRFLLHILPKGYVRIRHFGLFGSRYKRIKIDLIRKLQNIKVRAKEVVDESWKELLKRATGIEVDICPRCQVGRLTEINLFGLALNTS